MGRPRTHLECHAGRDGFVETRPTECTVSIGLSTRSPCDFIGTDEQYALSALPDLRVIKMRRNNVLYHATFRKYLFSTAQAWAEDNNTDAHFANTCTLTLVDGAIIPFYLSRGCYLLPRWFSFEAAERVRAQLLNVTTTLRTASSSLLPIPPHRHLLSLRY